MDVIGVGDIDIDIYLLLDHIPGQDEKVLADAVELHPGGMVANFLACLRSLGTGCVFNGCLGNDEYGATALADLEAIGVDTRGAVIKQSDKTYFCVVMLDGSGEKALIVAPTNCLFPEPEDVSPELIAQAKHLHTTAANLATATEAMQLAKHHGLTISLDLEPTMIVYGDALTQLLANVDLLFVNHRAASLLSQSDDVTEAATHILTLGPKVVCVTMGAQGSFIATSGESLHVDAFSVAVTDSTGAGDCYAAGFVHGYLQSWPLAKSARFASAVAAISVGHRGGHSGAPSYEDVNRFLRAHNSTVD